MKCVIISNRLPVSLVQNGSEFTTVPSGGGLATGLNSLEIELEKHWVGWPGLHVEETVARERIDSTLRAQNLHPVHLSPEQIQDYYEGYCNNILWPLCHYFSSYVEYEGRYWEAYQRVNEIFCREALKIIEPGDFVWIHDYHLMLLPSLIREQMPDVTIGYFHHIPFPSFELFRCLPERAEILEGLLGADLVGFHVHGYMRHFISVVYRVLNLSCNLDEVQFKNRVTRIEAFPMGINYELYHNGPTSPEAKVFATELQQIADNSKIILSVDRLDYSKGITFRLKSYADFLENNPEYKGKVTLVMVIVPSRDTVDRYAELKTKIDKTIGALNGAHAFMGWTPVHYFYRSFSFPELSAMYNMADIALVTPLRDGMNLVAKEYLAAQRDRSGVLILSEMAGAAVELTDALIVNPVDTKQTEKALLEALTMPEESRVAALRTMQKVVERQDVYRWARDYFTELNNAGKRNQDLQAKLLQKENLLGVVEAYRRAKKRLLVLDYDGTVVPIVKKPAEAFPKPTLLALLASLASDERNKVVISSGRDKDTMERWLGALAIRLVAEHGAFFKENGIWHEDCEPLTWDEEVLSIFEQITDKTPGSMIERKKTALVWHYRNVDPWFADLRVTQLVNSLLSPCTRASLQIMRGKKILEVKQAKLSKGTEIMRLLRDSDYDFVLAMGDDVTDEEMFAVLPPDAVAVKVGGCSDAATFWLPDQASVLLFLTNLNAQ